jgi:hypothetical protein
MNSIIDENQDVAGVYQAICTKNTMIKNGELQFMTMPHYLNFTTETFQAGLSWITILNKRKNFVLLLTNSITKK